MVRRSAWKPKGVRVRLWAPLSAMPAGVLDSFDLPDCYRELKNKNLRLLEPWGANPQT